MWDLETPVLILLAIAMTPFVVILLATVLAIFCLLIDAVTFAVSSFIHDVRSQRNSKED